MPYLRFNAVFTNLDFRLENKYKIAPRYMV